MPKMEVKSGAKPSLYAYPAPLEEKKREEREKVTTAVLSIAARQKRREGEKKKSTTGEEKMDVDEEPKVAEEKPKEAAPKKVSTTPSTSAEKKTAEETSETAKETSKEKKEPEPNFEMLQNPPRIMRQQLKVLSMPEGSAFTPLKEITIGGIIMMQHTSPDDQVLVEPVIACGPKNEDAKEPDAPEPFEFTED